MMSSRKYSLLYIAFFLALIFWAVQHLGVFFQLYWTTTWFDILMHYFGGFLGGILAVWCVFDSGFFTRRPHKWEVLAVAVLSVAVFAVAWELFEYKFGITGFESRPGYVEDTVLDLIMGLLGALSAGLLGAKEVFLTRHE